MTFLPLLPQGSKFLSIVNCRSATVDETVDRAILETAGVPDRLRCSHVKQRE